jgi:hypothetical protein
VLVEVSRRRFGEEYPDTLRAMANLAATVHAQSELGRPRVLATMRRIVARLCSRTDR